MLDHLSSLSLTKGFRPNTCASFYTEAVLFLTFSTGILRSNARHIADVEFHVQSHFDDTSALGDNDKARVTQVVIRLKTSLSESQGTAHAANVAVMQNHISALPRLQNVVLEASDKAEGTALANKLDVLRSSGRLQQRALQEEHLFDGEYSIMYVDLPLASVAQ